jgi:UDP-glucose 4-epimerase
MRIIVTGGAGFIGKHLLDWLVADGHEVLVVDDLSKGRRDHIPSGLGLEVTDLSRIAAGDLGQRFDAFGAEGVVHLSGVHFIPDCMRNPERTFDVNTKGTHTLIEAVRLSAVTRVVLASTLDVYAAEDRIHSESDVPQPSNIYGLTKFLSENLLEFAVRVGGCESGIALRLANVYGPNETNPHVIPDVVERIAQRDGPRLAMGYLGAARDFVFVEDVARAFGLAITRGPSGFHALNAGSGGSVPVRRVVEILQTLLGDDRPVVENAAAFRKFDRVSLTPRVEAIERVLGWRAETRIHEGLESVVSERALTLAVANGHARLGARGGSQRVR